MPESSQPAVAPPAAAPEDAASEDADAAPRRVSELRPEPPATKPTGQYTNAELGALAHLFRAEVYRSTTWRTRLDATTNWSVVSLGVALSVAYASPRASGLPLVFVGALILLFLLLEARRYRYFNVWRARSRWLETHFYAPMLTGEPYQLNEGWGLPLATDYRHPEYHISYGRAIGRRLRRNYLWIFFVQGFAYFGKAIIHPTPAPDVATFLQRLDIGPVHGAWVFLTGIVFYLALGGFTLFTWNLDRAKHGRARSGTTIG